MQSGDWVLVDLRPASRHREAHPAGAVNVSLYKEVADSLHIDSTRHLSTKAVRPCGQRACCGVSWHSVAVVRCVMRFQLCWVWIHLFTAVHEPGTAAVV